MKHKGGSHASTTRSHFLTHTVQMKPIKIPPFLIAIWYFLTHTVQMKPYADYDVPSIKGNFLTHTVQMKRVMQEVLAQLLFFAS